MLDARLHERIVGEANGSFSMMTSRSASPFTSTPSQKLAVPEQHRVAVVAELLQQALARRLALHEQAIAARPRRPARAQQLRRALRARDDW